MMQNSQSSPWSSSRCLYLRNTRAVASSCSDRSVSWSGGVFSNLYFKKWNWQNNICLRWGDIYVVHFQDGTVRLLGVEAGLYLAMNRFHISIQILFLVFRPFCVSPNICLTKWATKIFSKKEQFTVSMTLHMNDSPEKGNYMEATTLRTHLAFSLRKAKAPHILTSAIGESWWWPE